MRAPTDLIARELSDVETNPDEVSRYTLKSAQSTAPLIEDPRS